MATPGILLRMSQCRSNDQTTILVTWHQRAPVILLRTATESSNADSDSLRQELQRVRAELNAATTANDAHWRQQGGMLYIVSKLVSWMQHVSLSKQLTIVLLFQFLEPPLKHKRTWSRSHSEWSNMLRIKLRIRKIDIPSQMNSVAKDAIQGQRDVDV